MEIPKENIDGLLKRKDYSLFTKRYLFLEMLFGLFVCLALRECKCCKVYVLEQKNVEQQKTEYFRGKIGKPTHMKL